MNINEEEAVWVGQKTTHISRTLHQLWREGKIMRTKDLYKDGEYGWIPSHAAVFRDDCITYETYLKNLN